MSFNAYNALEISAGKPVKQELWTKASDNFDDHEDRLLSLEATALTLPNIQFNVSGAHWLGGAQNGLVFIRVEYNLTLTAAKLYVADIGSSGTLDVDIKKSSAGGGAFATIFSTRPTVAVAAGAHAVSTNAVLSTVALVAGDILRLDVITPQTDCEDFQVYLTYEI